MLKFRSVCESGKWACTHEKCSATCSVIGMGHFTTFDNKIYDFKGQCEYTLIEVNILTILLYNLKAS